MTGVGFAFYYPAYSAWLPALAPNSRLQAVNGFKGMVRPSAQALGPAVAGAVVASFSAGAALVLAAVFALGGRLALMTVPLTPVRRDLDGGAGCGPGRRRAGRPARGLRIHGPDAVAAGDAALRIPDDPRDHGAAQVLVPFLVKDRLGGGPSDHAMVLIAFGVGGAVGSLAMASVGCRGGTDHDDPDAGPRPPALRRDGDGDRGMDDRGVGVRGGREFPAIVIWGTLLQRRVRRTCWAGSPRWTSSCRSA